MEQIFMRLVLFFVVEGIKMSIAFDQAIFSEISDLRDTTSTIVLSGLVEHKNVHLLSQCGLVCLHMDSNCAAFLHNKNFKTCLVTDQPVAKNSDTAYENGTRWFNKDIPEPSPTTAAPLPPCPGNYRYNSTINYCYKFYSSWKTNAESIQQCENDGGYLAIADTPAKHYLIGLLAISNKNRAIRIDGSYTNENIWRYSNGQLMDTTRFNQGTAHYWSSRRCCHVHYGHTVYYYGNSCGGDNNFICEIKVSGPS